MRLPDEKQAEYVYMAPFTPRGKNNLAAWMVARNDGANYGKLRVYRFPKQSLVYGPAQARRITGDGPAAPLVTRRTDLGDDVQEAGVRVQRRTDQPVGDMRPVGVGGVDVRDACRDRLAEHGDGAVAVGPRSPTS